MITCSRQGYHTTKLVIRHFNTKLEGVRAIHLNTYDTHITQFSNSGLLQSQNVSHTELIFSGSLVLEHFRMLKELR